MLIKERKKENMTWILNRLLLWISGLYYTIVERDRNRNRNRETNGHNKNNQGVGWWWWW
jgi:hypothetical protein